MTENEQKFGIVDDEAPDDFRKLGIDTELEKLLVSPRTTIREVVRITGIENRVSFQISCAGLARSAEAKGERVRNVRGRSTEYDPRFVVPLALAYRQREMASPQLEEGDRGVTLAEFITEHKLGADFREICIRASEDGYPVVSLRPGGLKSKWSEKSLLGLLVDVNRLKGVGFVRLKEFVEEKKISPKIAERFYRASAPSKVKRVGELGLYNREDLEKLWVGFEKGENRDSRRKERAKKSSRRVGKEITKVFYHRVSRQKVWFFMSELEVEMGVEHHLLKKLVNDAISHNWEFQRPGDGRERKWEKNDLLTFYEACKKAEANPDLVKLDAYAIYRGINLRALTAIFPSFGFEWNPGGYYRKNELDEVLVTTGLMDRLRLEGELREIPCGMNPITISGLQVLLWKARVARNLETGLVEDNVLGGVESAKNISCSIPIIDISAGGNPRYERRHLETIRDWFNNNYEGAVLDPKVIFRIRTRDMDIPKAGSQFYEVEEYCRLNQLVLASYSLGVYEIASVIREIEKQNYQIDGDKNDRGRRTFSDQLLEWIVDLIVRSRKEKLVLSEVREIKEVDNLGKLKRSPDNSGNEIQDGELTEDARRLLKDF